MSEIHLNKFENHLLSIKTESQKMIHPNSHPTYNECHRNFIRVRWDSDPRHFNPIIDWLRARRSTWLSYEPLNLE